MLSINKAKHHTTWSQVASLSLRQESSKRKYHRSRVCVFWTKPPHVLLPHQQPAEPSKLIWLLFPSMILLRCKKEFEFQFHFLPSPESRSLRSQSYFSFSRKNVLAMPPHTFQLGFITCVAIPWGPKYAQTSRYLFLWHPKQQPIFG